MNTPEQEEYLPKAYLGSQLGFSDVGRMALQQIKPRIAAIGINVSDPFEECPKACAESGIDLVAGPLSTIPNEQLAFWQAANDIIGRTNEKNMEDSDVMLAILDGGHTVDEGLAGEMGYFSNISDGGPILGWRSDFRICENAAAPINIQLMRTFDKSKGTLVTGFNSFEKWLDEISQWRELFLKNT
jgi:nucleoside 2-deoxyribosyltransferase